MRSPVKSKPLGCAWHPRGKAYIVDLMVYTEVTALYSHCYLPGVLIPSHCRARKALIAKATSMSLTAFVVTAVLLIGSDSLASKQVVTAGGARQSPETAKQAEELFQDALLLSDTRDGESARRRLQEAMRLWVQMREPGKAAKAALQMGDRCKQARKYQDALDYYNQAQEVKLLPGPIKANVFNAIALVYVELYRGDLALRYFSKALEYAQKINDLPAQSLPLTGLANLHYQQGETKKALECISQAQKLNSQKDVADPALLCLLGQISQQEGTLDKAKCAFEDALAIYRKSGDAEGQVKSLCAISNLSLLASQKQAAIDQAEEAVRLAEEQASRAVTHADKSSARQLRWRACLSRGRAARAMGQKAKALDSYKCTIQHTEALWWAVYIATEASAIAFREEVQAAYREYVDLLVEQGQFNKAYELAEQGKARSLLNVTEARRTTPPSEGSQQEKTLRELSRSIARLRLQLLSSDLSPEQQIRLHKEIADAEYKMQETQLNFELASSRDRWVWSELANVESLQKKMAQDQMALAEFFLGEDRSFAWFFTPDGVSLEILPARKEIEKAVRAYLNVLASTPNHLRIEEDMAKLRRQAELLFATLFGSLSAHIKPSQRLIIVPDGLLHYLPFEALIHNGRYLVEDHEISYNPSASMLEFWQDSVSRVDDRDKMELLAIGDPVLEPGPKTLNGKPSRTGLSEPARQMLVARGFHLARLPRTRDEVEYIASLFPPDRRKVFVGKQGTEEALKGESLRRYRRLHFATHSLIDEKTPSRSAVVLTPGDDAEEDGVLEMSEIARLNLDCDLVVVSACQTGRGQILSGEGIVGLSRAFLYAGARSVVVSLWNVTDISTGQLMKNFYKNMTGGLSNAAALRMAKLNMLSSGKDTRHPHYWSPFVMVGKP
jgi:CHAT domain-containing protein